MEQSENYSISPGQRSLYRHRLIDAAEKLYDDELWLEIGHLLLRVCDKDDLSSQVSDRFVDGSPDHVFVQVMDGRPSYKFAGWAKRRRRLSVQPSRKVSRR